ncbi:MAG TPA: hypothetical protein VHZ31_04515 [Solirubrobacteraceae bacterium]|jgi:hypothetical protein|nr:hypothetical protein [Solirubrobacteraceae bacterium]
MLDVAVSVGPALRIVTLACATAALAGAAASRASAGEAVLWACHGPAGQALGVPSPVALSSGDAVTTTYGSGCAAPAPALGDGGLRAAFTRPDPSGGSQALWRVDVPAGVTLEAVHMTRRTSGFGGAPVLGGGQSYVTQTSSQTLESASVEDASNVALDGALDADPADGGYVRFGVLCAKAPSARCGAPSATPIAAEAGAIALRVRDDQPPRGAVGGLSTPAAGTLDLTLLATDAGLGLASAQVTLDGTPVFTADLGGASCAELSPQDATIDLPAGTPCPASVSGVALPVDTTQVADGPHALRVIVRDGAGNATTVADAPIVVANTPVATSSTAVLSIGSGDVQGPGDGGATGSGGAGGGGAGGGEGGGSGGGGTGIGGTVPSILALSIDAPASLGRFPETAGLSSATIAATVTATDAPVSLSIADGDSDRPPSRGHMTAGSHRLAAPLQAAAAAAAPQPLDLPIDPLLMRWNDVVAARRTAIHLTQRASARELRSGPYAKTVLITVSTQTP